MISIEVLRSFRVFDYAVFDFVASYIVFYFLASPLSKLFFKVKIKITRKQWMYLVVPLSVVFHLWFGQRTHLIEQLFSLNSGYSLTRELAL